MKKIIFFLMLIVVSCLKVTVTSSELVNKITGLNRTVEQAKVDLQLKKEIKKSIDSSKKVFLSSNNIKDFGYYDINIVEGRVLITGLVPEEKIKSFIISKISENLKIRELLDEIVITSQKRNQFSDFLLKKTITTKIFFKTKVRSINYEISVINGYVYIIGIAENEKELSLLTKSISTVKGVKEVISYVITLNSDKKIKFNY